MISMYATSRAMPASNSQAGPVHPSFLVGSKTSKPGSGLIGCKGGKARVKSGKPPQERKHYHTSEYGNTCCGCGVHHRPKQIGAGLRLQGSAKKKEKNGNEESIPQQG